MAYETIKFEKIKHIATLTFSRPKALNAINQHMLSEIIQCIDSVESERDIRCLILTGEGEKSFIAGADIKEMSSMNEDQARGFSQTGHRLLLKMQSLHCPVIAAVNGFALGGGTEMALASDFILASDNALFGLPEVSLGLIPGFGGTQRLAKFVGVARAAELIYSARKISAQEALVMGLVNRVTALKDLLITAQTAAEQISKNGPKAVAAAKKALKEGFSLPLEKSLVLEAEGFAKLFNTKDQKEGLGAFIEKRNPLFLGE